MPTTTDISSFTPAQQEAFKSAAALSNGKAQYTTSVPPPVIPAKTVEPTTLYSGNIQEKVIPKLNSRLKNLESGGTYVGIDGNQYYSADGSPVSAPIGAENTGSGWSAGGQSYKEGPTYVAGDDPESQKQNELLQSMKANLDATTLSLIRSIEQQSQVRKAQQADINKRLEAGTEQALLLGGSARYAPVSSTGIAAAQETYGLQQIAALDAQEKQLVAKARQAQSDGNYKIMGDALNFAEIKRKEKQAEAEKLSKAKEVEIQSVREQQRAASRDGAIAGLIGQGVTDPAQLLDYLNYDQAGNMVGDFSAKEIADTLKLLTVDSKAKDPKKIADDFKTDIGSFNYLRDNGLLPPGITKLDPSQQYFAYLNMQKLANSGKLSQASTYVGSEGSKGVITGKGAADPAQEQVIRFRLTGRLLKSLFGGNPSDSERAYIVDQVATMRSQGKDEEAIIDELTGFSTGVKTPYNATFRDIIIGKTDPQSQTQYMNKVSQLLASDNYNAALNTVEDVAMNTAKKEDPSAYLGRNTASQYTKKIDKIKQLLNEYGLGTVGPISGTLQRMSRNLKSNQATALQGAVADLTATFRNDIAGSAVTSSEASFLEPLIASLSDKNGNFVEKLNSLQNRILMQHNSTRETAGLPKVNVLQILDPKERLKLYESETQVSDEDFWGGSATGSSVIYNKDEGYVIPTE